MLLIRSDLDFILAQILSSEAHTPIGDPSLPFGIRTVSGAGNSIVTGHYDYGAADHIFPRLADPEFRIAENGTSYGQASGMVMDSQPRTISKLIVIRMERPTPRRSPPMGTGTD